LSVCPKIRSNLEIEKGEDKEGGESEIAFFIYGINCQSMQNDVQTRSIIKYHPAK
jgi:hypothetical protein